MPAKVRAQAGATLFPSAALAQYSAAEQFEPASVYSTGTSGAELVAVAGRQTGRGDQRYIRDSDKRLHPYSNSHNLDWIEKYRRRGVRSFNPYNNSALPETVPAFQVYGRQQHHGQSAGFGHLGALASPTGFGHGGFQGIFSNAALNYDRDRPPNFRFGPLTANFDVHTSAEWFDRLPTTLTPDGRPGGDDEFFIISGGIDTMAQIRVGERGVLDLQVGAGFDYYPNGRPGNDGREDSYLDFQVLPNTYATYTFGVGEAEVSIYDRFARFRNRAYSYYSLDPLDYADYQEHAIGATVRLPFNDRLAADLGYEFDQIDSLGGDAELLDRSTHNVFGGLTYSPDGGWEIGTQVSAAEFDYDLAERPDGSSATAGVFGKLPVSEYTRLSATAGVHRFEFDQADDFDDSESLDSVYWSFSIENDLNDRLTHGVTVGKGAAIGISSNYIETHHAGYDAQWRVFDETVITAGVSYQLSNESGGEVEEELDSFNYLVGLRQQVTEHTSIGVNYSLHSNESDLTDRDYDQQRLQVFCAVDLNENLEMRASYQRWDVDSQAERNSFTQNSATLGFTLHF